MPRTLVADGPCCESTLIRFMKNWPMSGACQVVQGLGDLWNLLSQSVNSQVFISTSAESLSTRCNAAPTPCGPPQSCPTITKPAQLQLIEEAHQIGDMMR